MQANDPYTQLHPSESWVSRDYALSMVKMLASLQEWSPSLMESIVGWARTGHAPAFSSVQWIWLVAHSIIREDNTLEERVRDIVRMTVSGDSAPFTIDGSIF